MDEIIELGRLEILKDREPIIKKTNQLKKWFTKHKIPIEKNIDSLDFTISAFPEFYFNEIPNLILNELIKKDDKFVFKKDITNYKIILFWNNIRVAEIANVFYPALNNKYIIPKHLEKEEINNKIREIFYIDSTFQLIEILHRLYSPDFTCKHKELDEILITKIKELEIYKNKRANIKRFSMFDKKLNKYGILIPTIESTKNTLMIIKSIDLPIIKDIIKEIYGEYEEYKNIGKVPYDIRIINYVFKKGKQIILKVYNCLDYELIPYEIINEYKVVHPYVTARIHLIEYMIFRMIRDENSAKYKMIEFKECFEAPKKTLEYWDFEGVYKNYDFYIKELRREEISKIK